MVITEGEPAGAAVVNMLRAYRFTALAAAVNMVFAYAGPAHTAYFITINAENITAGHAGIRMGGTDIRPAGSAFFYTTAAGRLSAGGTKQGFLVAKVTDDRITGSAAFRAILAQDMAIVAQHAHIDFCAAFAAFDINPAEKEISPDVQFPVAVLQLEPHVPHVFGGAKENYVLNVVAAVDGISADFPFT